MPGADTLNCKTFPVHEGRTLSSNETLAPGGCLRGWAGNQVLTITRGPAHMGHGASTTQWPSFLAQSGAMVARDLWQVWLPSPVALSPGYQNEY